MLVREDLDIYSKDLSNEMSTNKRQYRKASTKKG